MADREALCADAEVEPVMLSAGPEGPGGWDCHTFPNGLTLPLICLADNCPDKGARNPDRFAGELL